MRPSIARMLCGFLHTDIFIFTLVTGFLAKGQAWFYRRCLAMLHYSRTLTISDPTPGMGPVVLSHQCTSSGGCF